MQKFYRLSVNIVKILTLLLAVFLFIGSFLTTCYAENMETQQVLLRFDNPLWNLLELAGYGLLFACCLSLSGKTGVKFRRGLLVFTLGLILLLGLGRKINFKDNLAMSVLILGVLIALVVVSFMMTFRIGNKVNLNRNTSGVIAAYLIAQQLPEKLRDKVAFVLTDGGNGTHVGDYMLRDALPNTIKDRNVIILDCVGKGPRLGIGYFEASKANAEKLEAIVKAKDPEAKLHTSLVDEDHVKYTSLSFYEKGMIVCRGKNLNGSLIVENTATNHDDEVEREKIEALAADLTELAKQIS